MGCELDVRIQPEGPIPAGSGVRVTATATADTAATCRGISCEALWEASRRPVLDRAALMEPGRLLGQFLPGTDKAIVFTQRAPGGELGPGVALNAEFRFALPGQGPITYRGKLFDIEWRVRVSLDMAWRDDPARTLTLEVVPRY